MKNFSSLIIIALTLFTSCDNSTDEPVLFPSGKGLFILNEGNFMAGNGSVSFYSDETGLIYNDLFSSANKRALGDVPTFMAGDGERGFIVVNNSGTLEVVDLRTMKSIKTLTGLVSPRQMVIYNGKGYVSSLVSDKIAVLDVSSAEVTGTIDAGCSTEAMVMAGGRLFAANWSGGNKIVVIDPLTDEVITSVTTGLEPESMAVDRNGMLWVLCTGGYMNEEVPRIMKINPANLEVEAEMFFRTVTDNPSCLTVNTTGDTLYYIDEGIRRMPVTANSLPSEAFIDAGDRLFYRLSVSGPKGRIYVTDAIDYQQKGDLLIYSGRGGLTDTEQAGIIPGYMFFMQN
jgi:YVTN family beta-propeller protein